MQNKIVIGLIGSIAGYFTGLPAILLPCLGFVCVDFVLGVMTSRKAAKKAGEEWGILSEKLWDSLMKLVCVGVAVVLTQLFSTAYVDWLDVDLGKLIAGFISAVELYSILGHLYYLSDWEGFDWLKKLLKKEIQSKTGLTDDDK